LSRNFLCHAVGVDIEPEFDPRKTKSPSLRARQNALDTWQPLLTAFSIGLFCQIRFPPARAMRRDNAPELTRDGGQHVWHRFYRQSLA
jgi:hypothetical protein